jgi:hypothetical protein
MMKSASLLDQEKEGLDRMIDKLTNLAKAFEILGELTSANKKQYEFLMNKIGGLEKLCESLSGSKLLKATIKQPFFLLHVMIIHLERQIPKACEGVLHIP